MSNPASAFSFRPAFPFLSLLASFAVVLFSAGCAVDPDAADAGNSDESATISRDARSTLGFESPALWTPKGSETALSASRDHTEGSRSLSVNSENWTELTSPALKKLVASGELSRHISLDLKLDSTPTWGGLRIEVDSPSSDIHWSRAEPCKRDGDGEVEKWVCAGNEVPLAGMPRNEWLHLPFEFNLSDSELAQLSQAEDVRLRIFVNAPRGIRLLDHLKLGSAPLEFDQLGEEAVFGFESFDGIVCEGACELSENAAQGEQALKLIVAGETGTTGTTGFTTAALTSENLVGETLGLSLQQPLQPKETRNGTIQVYISSETAHLDDELIGQKAFDDFAFRGVYRRLQFRLPAQVLRALNAQTLNDIRVRVAFTDVDPGEYFVDGLSLVDELPPIAPPVPSPAADAILGFNDLAGWNTSAGQIVLGDGAHVVEGAPTGEAHSIGVLSAASFALTSRPLSSLGKLDKYGTVRVKVWRSLNARPAKVTLSLDLPSKGIHHAIVGEESTDVGAEGFQQLAFRLGPEKATLEAGRYDDLRIRFEVTNPDASAIYFDALDLTHEEYSPERIEPGKPRKLAQVAAASTDPIKTRREFVAILPTTKTWADVLHYQGAEPMLGGSFDDPYLRYRTGATPNVHPLRLAGAKKFHPFHIEGLRPADGVVWPTLTATGTSAAIQLITATQLRELYVPNGKVIRLNPGDYYFQKVTFDTGSTVHLNNTAGQIRVFIYSQVNTVNATMVAATTTTNNVFWLNSMTGGSISRTAGQSFGTFAANLTSFPANSTQIQTISAQPTTLLTVAGLAPANPSCASPSACSNTIGCTNLDTDQDGISDCEEQADLLESTDPNVFNGLQARMGVPICGTPSCTGTTFASADSCLPEGSGTIAKVAAGWGKPNNSNGTLLPPAQPDMMCSTRFLTAFSACDPHPSTTVTDLTGIVRLDQTGRHCFLERSIDNYRFCQTLGIDGAVAPLASYNPPTRYCATLEAGQHNLRYYFTSLSQRPHAAKLLYCFGGASDCTPTEVLPSTMVYPTAAEAALVSCDSDNSTCTDLCPCAEGAGSCTDNDLCTTDLCNWPPGVNVNRPVIIADSSSCTIDSCDPATGIHHTPPSDGDACTADLCDAVSGESHPIPDDANPCTEFVCSSSVSGGSHVVRPELAVSDDNICTTDLCTATGYQHLPLATQAGPCVNVAASSCSPTTGLQLTYLPAGTVCAEGKTCTTSGQCAYPGASPLTLPPGQATVAAGDLMSAAAQVGDCGTPQLGAADKRMQVMGVVQYDTGSSILDGLAGVQVSVANRCEYGHVLTRADGTFKLVLPGGGKHSIRFEKAGYMAVEREVSGIQGDFLAVPKVILIPATSLGPVNVSTAVTIEAPAFTDESGSQIGKGSVFFGAGTTFTVAGQAQTNLTLDFAPFTSGVHGRARMPAGLPPGTDYTHAFDISLSKNGVALDHVQLNPPAVYYFDNFRQSGQPTTAPPLDSASAGLGSTDVGGQDTGTGTAADYAVGARVPAFYYNYDTSAWERLPNGRIVKIKCSGTTVNSLEGLTTPTQAGEPSLALRTGELAQLQAAVTAGKRACNDQLWRVELSHFSTIDLNWASRTPEPIASLPDKNGPDGGMCGGTIRSGSILNVEERSLREELPLPGIGQTLNYNSNAMFGDATGRDIPRFQIFYPSPLYLWSTYEANSYPGGMGQLGQEVYDLNGNLLPGTGSFGSMEWDGLVDGQRVYGSFRASTMRSDTFIVPGPFPVVLPYIVGRNLTVRSHDASTRGLGGWTLSDHHVFDGKSSVLYRGDRGVERGVNTGVVVALPDTEIPPPTFGYGKDTNFYVLRDGTILAGTSCGSLACLVRILPDGSRGVTISFEQITGFAVDPRDESVLVGSIGGASANRLLRLPPPATWIQGITAPTVVFDFNTVTCSAGGYTASCALDAISLDKNGDPIVMIGPSNAVPGPPVSRFVHRLSGGSLSKAMFSVLRRVNAEARLWTSPFDEDTIYASFIKGFDYYLTKWNRDDGFSKLAGCTNCPTGETSCNCPSLAALQLAGETRFEYGSRTINSLFEEPDGSVVIGVTGSRFLWRIGTDGNLSIFAGSPNAFTEPSVSLTPTNRAGFGVYGAAATRGPDGDVWVAAPYHISGNAAGPLYYRFLRITERAPGSGGLKDVVSLDGSEIYTFYDDGRHYQTRDARTQALLREFTYDPTSLLLTGFSESGLTSTVSRSSNTVTVTGPFQQSTVITLDSRGYASNIARTGAPGVPVVHDSSGLLKRMVDERGYEHLFEYAPDGSLVGDSGPAENGRAVQTLAGGLTNAEGEKVETKFRRSPDGDTRTVTNSDGSGYSLAYNEGTKQTNIANSDGSSELIEWGMHPVYPQIRAQLSRKQTLPGGQWSQTAWTATNVGGVRTDTFTRSNLSSSDQSTVVTDVNAKTVLATSAKLRTVTTTFDSQGRTLSVQLGNLEPSYFTYDTQGRVQYSGHGVGATKQQLAEHQYQATGAGAGYLAKVLSPGDEPNEQHVSTFTPDAFGRPLGTTTSSLLGAEAAIDSALSLGYDGRGLLISVNSGTVQSLSYTPADHLKYYNAGATYSSASSTEWIWDKAKRLKKVIFPSATNQATLEFRRDDLSAENPGRLRSLVETNDGLARTTAFTYGDELLVGEVPVGKPAQVAQIVRAPHTMALTWNGPLLAKETRTAPGFTKTGYGWTPDPALRVGSDTITTGTTDTVVSTASYGYNGDDQLSSITSGSSSIQYQFDGDYLDPQVGNHGLLEGVVSGDIFEAYTRDSFGRASVVETTGTTVSGSETLLRYDYTYTKDGRILTEQRTRGANVRLREFTYTSAGQLASVNETRSGILPQPATKTNFQYDSSGNRVHSWITPQVDCDPSDQSPACNFVYNARDELTSAKGFSRTYTARGSLASVQVSGGYDAYSYDLNGSAVGVDRSGTSVDVLYENDPMNRRVARWENASMLAQYIWSRPLRMEAELASASSGGALKRRYLYGLRPNVPDLFIDQVAGKTYRIITDHLGSPSLVVNVDDATDVLLEAEYDAWGKVVRYALAGVELSSNQISQWPIPFGFAGGLFERRTGMVRFGARDYDPSVGRWTSRDPILFEGGQGNLFVYVNNDPVNSMDPTGLYTEVVFWAPTGFGSSSFGHVSVVVNGTSYSFGPGGMNVDSATRYLARNTQFREGRGLMLGLSPEQERLLSNLLARHGGRYSVTSNNCTDPIECALSGMGLSVGDAILPEDLFKNLAPFAIGQTYHAGGSPGFAPWSTSACELGGY